jgi:hypothetical protein
MCIFVASCGQTYRLESISVAPATGYTFTTLGESGPLTVTAYYSNTKSSDVTAVSKYVDAGSSAPNSPAAGDAVHTDLSGVVHVSSTVEACTYVSTTTNGVTTITPDPYAVNVSYEENGVIVHASVPINVATAPGCTQ